MHGEDYGGPGSFALVTISIIFAWISQLRMDEIAFLISAFSGLLACISFGLRIALDLKKMKKNDQDETVDNERK